MSDGRDVRPRRRRLAPRHSAPGVGGLELGVAAKLPRAGAAVLVDRTPEAHHRQPAPRVGNLLARGNRGVEALPRLCVTRFQVALVEVHAARAQAPPDAPQHLLAQPPELLAQQALGAKAAQSRGAHSP